MDVPKITVVGEELLSSNYYVLKLITYNYEHGGMEFRNVQREVYNRGNGAAILLYNPERRTVILTRQFRLPIYISSAESGMLVEVCAGLLDDDNPEQCIIRETAEETGYEIESVRKVFEAYMSPGAITEVLHCFVGEYSPNMKTGLGGGLTNETEDIEVLELLFDDAYNMIASGEIKDAKSIMLLQYAKINKLV